MFLASLSACAFLREPTPSPQPIVTPIFPIVRVTADQIARAMEQDQFFSQYGESTLLIQGTILLVNQQDNHFMVELDTTVPTKVWCDLGNHSSVVEAGDRITIQSAFPQRDALRQASALVLRNCSIP